MPELVPEGSKQNPLRVLWDYFLSLDKFTRLFIITSLLVISVTPIIIQNRQTISQFASGTSSPCLPLPKCATNGMCPEIIKYNIPNHRWCLPNPTPVPTTPQVIACGYPRYTCPTGFTCGACTGAIVAGPPCVPTYTCMPTVTSPTPTPMPTCGNIICKPGQGCLMSACPLTTPMPPCTSTSPTGCPTPRPPCVPTYTCMPTVTSPTPIPPPFVTCGPTNPKYLCPSGQACIYSNGQYVCASGYACSGISGGSCPAGQTCQYDVTALTDICKL
jgi:hypothetical protein